jgi:hypothetical protein
MVRQMFSIRGLVKILTIKLCLAMSDSYSGSSNLKLISPRSTGASGSSGSSTSEDYSAFETISLTTGI